MVAAGGKRGFARVDLLALIVLLGIVAACLPACISGQRQAARRATCRNTLKQLTLALQNYHTLHRIYPINWGVVATDPTPQEIVPPTPAGSPKGFSWLCMILPLVEETQLYEQINFEGTVAQNRTTANKALFVFHCPADTHEGTLDDQVLCSAVTNYKAVAGANWPGTGSGLFRYRKLDASPPNGPYSGRHADTYNGLDFGDGWCCRGASGPGKRPPGKPVTTKIADVRDGISHTFAIGEAVPEYCNWSGWFYFEGSTATCAIPLNWRKPGMTPNEIAGHWSDSMSFRSRHSGGANFGFLDGSTRFISQDIELAAYRALATIDGGEVLGVKGPQEVLR